MKRLRIVRWQSSVLFFSVLFLCLGAQAFGVSISALQELLFETSDFEGSGYEGWTVEGTAFSSRPYRVSDGNKVAGIEGEGCGYSGVGGVGGTGRLISPEFSIKRDYINFKLMGGRTTSDILGVELYVDGKMVRSSSATEYYSNVLEWRTWDVREFAGRKAAIRVSDQSTAWLIAVDQFVQSDTPAALVTDSSVLFSEIFRPQFHFTTKTGWLNDPNGLVYYKGVWHLFYQHMNMELPGVKLWGHAISLDLLHWEYQPVAIWGDAVYHIFSGTAVVDLNNDSGLKSGVEDPLLAFYTLQPRKSDINSVQAFSYSTDGGATWNPYENNPVLSTVTGDKFDRDPSVFFEPTTETWFLAIYHCYDNLVPRAETGYGFYKSKNLKNWEYVNEIKCRYQGECPNMFQMPVDGNTNSMQWVLLDGGGSYVFVDFDDEKFNVVSQEENPWILSLWGKNYYATQTFYGAPDGRKIQVGWMGLEKTQFPNGYPGMPFNQQMSVPRELTLKTTTNGLRIFRNPAKELEALRSNRRFAKTVSLVPGTPYKTGLDGELLDIEMDVNPADSGKITFNIRGQEMVYDISDGQLKGFTRTVSLKPENGILHFRFLVDRTSIEIFCNHGQLDLSGVFFAPESAETFFASEVAGTEIRNLTVYDMRSIWSE